MPIIVQVDQVIFADIILRQDQLDILKKYEELIEHGFGELEIHVSDHKKVYSRKSVTYR